MGFFFRKSIKLGPLRLNLSKSGIGVSTGIKGLRVGTGPRGAYVHAGRGGLYYRKHFGGAQKGSPPPPSPSAIPAAQALSSADAGAEASQLFAFSLGPDSALVAELKRRRKGLSLGPGALILCCFLMLGCLIVGLHWFLNLLILVGAVAMVVYTFRRDKERRITRAPYTPKPEVVEAFVALGYGAKDLVECSALWEVWDPHASVAALMEDLVDAPVGRNPADIRTSVPENLDTNAIPIALRLSGGTMYFLPDQVLVYYGDEIGSISYADLTSSVQEKTFVEHQPPSDATVSHHTWRHPNVSGGPDRRFAINPSLPVCLYDEVHLSTPYGLSVTLNASRAGAGLKFVMALQALRKLARPGEEIPAETPPAAPALPDPPPPLESTEAQDRLALLKGLSKDENLTARLLIEIMRSESSADPGLLQRRSHLTLERIEYVLGIMEKLGLVGPADPAGQRELGPILGADSLDAEEEVSEEDEETIDNFIEMIRAQRAVSDSFLQRHLGLSYTRVARILDIMERRGLIGAQNGARGRKILFDLD